MAAVAFATAPQMSGVAWAAPLATVLSPSQVRAFMDCPTRWWYKYGLNLPEPKNSNLSLGIAVHAAIETNFRQKLTSLCDLPDAETTAAFHESWDALGDETEFREDESPAELAGTGEQLVRKYMQEAAPAIQPAAVELEVYGVIGGVPVQGRVDVLDTEGRILDVKTRSKKPVGFDPADSFQLATYQQITPGASERVRIDTLVKTKVPQYIPMSHTITAADRRATEMLYPLAQEAMRSGLYLPNRTSPLCSRRNCAFWRACEDEFGGQVSE